MAIHFARGIVTPQNQLSSRISAECHAWAKELPRHHRERYLASHALLAEMLFMLYGITRLPPITLRDGKPAFADSTLPAFSQAWAGNIAGIALTTEGLCGLDMALHPTSGCLRPYTPNCKDNFTRSETTWINNQNDPQEARIQLAVLHQSIKKLSDNHCNEVRISPCAGRLRVNSNQRVEALCDAEDILIWALCASPGIETLRLWEFNHHSGWQALPDPGNRNSYTGNRMMRFATHPAEQSLLFC
ncbi:MULTISPECIES: holo-ACP synthase [Tenebrionibacter/Tenebrionicola group]|uniref:Phosphopantetheinyl transferase n=2 Tax=Tenebrionibacter/Tenebrionicola group TaxID=2969848 RepID=A0A8K0V520_9ENTR|nr:MULTISPECIES: hypothetical protein [Tenebrionibacter/Tenebrionicola group]MBK4714327.1 hypothetical protein [Tenebrionibacter intestinalis]MBV5095266.1 hypothetical protein [Tenebrionicola larvae]